MTFLNKPTIIRPAALLLALSLTAAACGSSSETATGADGDELGASAVAQSDDGAGSSSESENESESDDEAAMTEPGMVRVTIENLASFAIGDSGVFNTPAGADEPGPALPGDRYQFSVYAQPGDRLSFATMLVQTNDWFVAPDPAGIALYDEDGTPVSGDLTDQLRVFDAGTETDQPFGEGADQAPRQSGPDTGADDSDPTVRELGDRSARDYVSVVIVPGDGGRFDVTVKNDSTMAIVPTPLAPGVYAAHSADASLFAVGGPDAGNGLEALAEDGDPAPLADHLAAMTGVTTPLAPGAWAAHDDGVALFTLGEPDAGLGLEAVAEDGDPAALGEALAGLSGVSAAGTFALPDGDVEPGPLLPGGSYVFEAEVTPGGRLSFATMLVQSNDWLFATPEEGLAVDGLSGDITDQLIVVDLGTEADQRPGFGADQAPRQAGPDTGAADPDDTVRPVDQVDPSRYIRVSVEPIN